MNTQLSSPILPRSHDRPHFCSRTNIAYPSVLTKFHVILRPKGTLTAALDQPELGEKTGRSSVPSFMWANRALSSFSFPHLFFSCPTEAVLAFLSITGAVTEAIFLFFQAGVHVWGTHRSNFRRFLLSTMCAQSGLFTRYGIVCCNDLSTAFTGSIFTALSCLGYFLTWWAR